MRSRVLAVIIYFMVLYYMAASCWWLIWLGHCATSRNVAGSIPEDVIGIFHWRNEYQECFLGGKGGRFLGLTTLPPSCTDCTVLGASTSWKPRDLSRPVMGLFYHFILYTALYWACRWFWRAEICCHKLVKWFLIKVVLDCIYYCFIYWGLISLAEQ